MKNIIQFLLLLIGGFIVGHCIGHLLKSSNKSPKDQKYQKHEEIVLEKHEILFSVSDGKITTEDTLNRMYNVYSINGGDLIPLYSIHLNN